PSRNNGVLACITFSIARHYGRARRVVGGVLGGIIRVGCRRVGRRPFGGGLAPSPAASPAAPGGKLGRDGIPLGLDRLSVGTHGLGIGPVVRIQTLGRLCQPVAFFGRPGAPGDALEQFAVPGAITRGRRAAKRPAQQRLIVDDERRGGGRFRPPLGRPPTRAATVPIAVAIPVPVIGPAD